MKNKLVCIGNGIAEMRTVEKNLKLELGTYQTSVFCKGLHTNYKVAQSYW